MIKFPHKQKKEDDGLDIIDNVKEPFSFANFFEDHVITNWKKFKKILEERGVLFFLVSPFQYRNRLIAKISLVIVGILIGIVPRTFTLIDETKERNASSEMATIVDSTYQTGKITIRPLASGQYEKQHVLTFLIGGDTSTGVPSTTDKYEVTLSQKRGVSDIVNVSAQYEILPINTTSRLLVVYVNNQKQNDETGNYNISAKIKSEDVDDTSIAQMEVVLSNNQKTTSLFDGDGIHLSVLSNSILDLSEKSIAKAETTLKDAMEVYTLNEERLAAMNMSVDMSRAQLDTFVKEHLQLPTLNDTSNSEDIKAMEYDKEFATNHPMELKAALTYDDIHYSIDDDRSGKEDAPAYTEIDTLTTSISNVISAVSGLNAARSSKYLQLVALQNALNQTLTISDIKGNAIIMP